MRTFLLFIIAAFILASCAPQGHYLTQAQVNDTASVHEPIPVLRAWRKKPGAPKTVAVRGYYKKDGTYVPPHYRSRAGVSE